MENYAYYQSPLGILKIGYRGQYITHIKIVPVSEPDHCPSLLSDLAAAQILEYLQGSRTGFDFPISPAGTPFQISVWNALTQIPYGEVRTYGQIAAAIRNPGAARAVGMACNRNPLWIVIPCHRVIGSSKNLTGYAGGLPMKQTLLELEQQNR